MRAARGREPLFAKIGYAEAAVAGRGRLGNGQVAHRSRFAAIWRGSAAWSREHVTLLLARTASLAGTIQIVARSLETGLAQIAGT